MNADLADYRGYFINQSAKIRLISVCPRPISWFLILDYNFQPIFLNFEFLSLIRI